VLDVLLDVIFGIKGRKERSDPGDNKDLARVSLHSVGFGIDLLPRTG
jgi:hypothetical protein